MQFLKRNLFWVIIGLVVVLSAVVSGVIISSKISEKEKYAKEVNKIIEAEKSFITSDFALETGNVDQAEANFRKAEEKFSALITELNEKYVVPDVEVEMTALQFKRHLRSICIKMENVLRGEDVWIPESLKWFNYDSYMRGDVLPSEDEIQKVLKQLEIIQELIYVISQSQVVKFEKFTRVNGFEIVKRDLFDYMPFSFKLTGNMETIRQFVNSVHDAKYFFVIRDLNIAAAAAKMNSPPSMRGRDKEVNLAKKKRLAYEREPVAVTAQITLDYLEFHDKE